MTSLSAASFTPPRPATLTPPVATGVAHPDRPLADPKQRPWQDDVIYFVMTDRFEDGDKTNDQGVNKADINRWHGGDLQGIINKADYIKNLGVTALWVTPPMQNQDTFVNTDGYHGYWVTDYYKVDKHMGDVAKFHEMVDAMHQRGIKVIVDIPLNHVAWDHPFYKDPGKKDWFHHNGDVNNWDDEWQQQNCSIFGLPDLAQENPEVEKYLLDVGRFWAGQGIDGFRLDAVRSVPLPFWEKFDKEMHKVAGPNFYLIGEYFHGDPNRVPQFQNQGDMNGLVDYPLYFTLDNTIPHGHSMRDLADKVQWFNKVYPHPEMMGGFPDNHDTKRLLTECGGDRDKAKLTLAFLMTMNRIPTIYYGTEQGMQSDPNGWSETSRRDMDFKADPDMMQYFQKLASIRLDVAPLRHGNLLEMWQDDEIYAYDRKSAEGEAVVVLNNDYRTQSRDIPLRAESQLQNGQELKDLLTGKSIKVENGHIHVDTNGKSAGIYVPA